MGSKMNWGWGATPPSNTFCFAVFSALEYEFSWFPRTFRASCQEKETGATPSTALPAPKGNVLGVGWHPTPNSFYLPFVALDGVLPHP
jgi:hypothetical protein